MQTPPLQINSVEKTYIHNKIRIPAVRGLCMSLEPGEIVCLFGRSGCGKTTLLNLAGGLDRPDSGSIAINGTNLQEVPAGGMPQFRRKNIGFVFQHFNLIPYLTALENAALPLKYSGIPQKERMKRAEEMLKRLGLGDRLDFMPCNLSGGQIQRVAFARAAVAAPAIILADEPTGQLDSASAREMVEAIRLLNREDGLVFLIATHDPIIASICSRTLYMEDGAIIREERSKDYAPWQLQKSWCMFSQLPSFLWEEFNHKKVKRQYSDFGLNQLKYQ